jgi:hypothetical protein
MTVAGRVDAATKELNLTKPEHSGGADTDALQLVPGVRSTIRGARGRVG